MDSDTLERACIMFETECPECAALGYLCLKHLEEWDKSLSGGEDDRAKI